MSHSHAQVLEFHIYPLVQFIIPAKSSLKSHLQVYNIASNPEYDGYQRALASMVYKFFDKKSMGSGVAKSSPLILADELHKPVIKKINKRKVYSQFKDNIWIVDLADMQSLSKKNKGIFYAL